MSLVDNFHLYLNVFRLINTSYGTNLSSYSIFERGKTKIYLYKKILHIIIFNIKYLRNNT